jgi:hypothetical protein
MEPGRGIHRGAGKPEQPAGNLGEQLGQREK